MEYIFNDLTRQSKVLKRIAKKDKRISKYYWQDGSHWLILEDGYTFDYGGCETTCEYTVAECLDKIKMIVEGGK